MKKIVFLFLLSAVFYSCKKEQKEEVTLDLSEEFNNLLTDFNEEGLILDPSKATKAGDKRYNDQYPNFLSENYIAKKKTYYSKYKQAFEAIPDSLLNATERMTKDVLLWDCNINLEEFNFKKDLMPIDQMWSKNLDFNQWASGTTSQPFKTVTDYENWLTRVDAYLVWLNSARENMKQGIAEGYVLPKSLILKVIPQFEVLATGSVEDNLYYSPIKNFPDSFTEEERDKLTKAYTAMVSEKIIPAHQEMVTFLTEEYLPVGKEDFGIAIVTPLGKDYYDFQIKKYTTTSMTADEIHELGLKEVARIRNAMEEVKTKVGFEGDLKSFFDFVRVNKELMPFTNRSQVIAYYDSIHKVMQPQLDKLFGEQPKTGFEVRRTEPFREKSAAANYSRGSLDGSRPGIFYAPIPVVEEYNVFNKESLFLHEAIPGHHFQISLQQENQDLPDFRRTLWYSAYGEGWALYAESMGEEVGLYKDPYQYFGMLSSEIHRAVRLVVDTGLHSKGWSREEAIQYCMENEAISIAKIESEIERYMANPGQALSYKIGQLKILELRAKAEETLGEKFDIKEFHNEVLETGCIPLELFEEKINSWIASKK